LQDASALAFLLVIIARKSGRRPIGHLSTIVQSGPLVHAPTKPLEHLEENVEVRFEQPARLLPKRRSV
jgi:hypothetical protein